MMAPGSIVEPGAVKRFKSRLNDGHIVEVCEQDFEKWQKYFRERIGIDIQLPKPEPSKVPEESGGAPEIPSELAKAAVSAAKVAKHAVAATAVKAN